MIYKFITDKDLDVGMKQYFRDQIMAGVENRHILSKSEGAAVSMMKTKLNGRYDVSKVFPVFAEWDKAKAFAQDDFCSYYDVVYKAKQPGTNKIPKTDADYWEQIDPRDMLLVMYCVAITLYFFVESISPRKISDDIVNAYTNAMEWLEDVKEGKENPDLPLLETGGMNDIPNGSNEQYEHYY